jgi:hypothetical protein
MLLLLVEISGQFTLLFFVFLLLLIVLILLFFKFFLLLVVLVLLLDNIGGFNTLSDIGHSFLFRL